MNMGIGGININTNAVLNNTAELDQIQVALEQAISTDGSPNEALVQTLQTVYKLQKDRTDLLLKEREANARIYDTLYIGPANEALKIASRGFQTNS